MQARRRPQASLGAAGHCVVRVRHGDRGGEASTRQILVSVMIPQASLPSKLPAVKPNAKAKLELEVKGTLNSCETPRQQWAPCSLLPAPKLQPHGAVLLFVRRT